jgi:two-component system sensor histidine kinase UhpB
MPLRVRLITLIGLVLLVSVACGSLLVGWHAATSVRTELHAALEVGAQTIRNGIGDSGGVDDRARVDNPLLALRHLVATFNGNRHVRATLVDARDQPIATSELFVPTQPVPDWFRDLIGGEPGTLRLPVSLVSNAGASKAGASEAGAIILRTDPINEIGEVWGQSRDAVLVLAGFATMSALLICAVVGRALRPLESLSNAFDQIGKGNYHGTLREHGPPELARLANGFNDMTRRLATIAVQNRRLNERLLTLQAEERADLARDLHDEIGPLLFAVDMTAATIERLATSERGTDIAAHVHSIQDAVGRMQRHVRMLLGRLRPVHAIGLAVAIDRLAAFWHGRNPEIVFDIAVSVEEDRLADDLRETIYRVVQEAISNAIRHGKPTRVEIAVAADDSDEIRIEVTDDGIGMAMKVPMGNAPMGKGAIGDVSTGRDPTQLGLVGMRERVMAMAGSLSIQRGRDGSGLTIVARLPCVNSLQSQNEGGPW